MPKFDVIIRGAKGYFETGQYETAFRKGAYDASKDILDDLQDKGYIRLSHPDCTARLKTYERALRELRAHETGGNHVRV